MRTKTLVLIVIAVSLVFTACGKKEVADSTWESNVAVVKQQANDDAQQRADKEKADQEAQAKADEEQKFAAFAKIRTAMIDFRNNNFSKTEPDWCRPEDRFAYIQEIRWSIEGHVGSDFTPLREGAVSVADLAANGIDKDEIVALYNKYGNAYMAFLKQSFAQPHSMLCGEGEGQRDFGDRVFVLETIHLLEKPHTYDEPIISGWTDDVWLANMRIALHGKAVAYLQGKAASFELLPQMYQYGITVGQLKLTDVQQNELLSQPEFRGMGGV